MEVWEMRLLSFACTDIAACGYCCWYGPFKPSRAAWTKWKLIKMFYSLERQLLYNLSPALWVCLTCVLTVCLHTVLSGGVITCFRRWSHEGTSTSWQQELQAFVGIINKNWSIFFSTCTSTDTLKGPFPAREVRLRSSYTSNTSIRWIFASCGIVLVKR